MFGLHWDTNTQLQQLIACFEEADNLSLAHLLTTSMLRDFSQSVLLSRMLCWEQFSTVMQPLPLILHILFSLFHWLEKRRKKHRLVFSNIQTCYSWWPERINVHKGRGKLVSVGSLSNSTNPTTYVPVLKLKWTYMSEHLHGKKPDKRQRLNNGSLVNEDFKLCRERYRWGRTRKTPAEAFFFTEAGIKQYSHHFSFCLLLETRVILDLGNNCLTNNRNSFSRAFQLRAQFSWRMDFIHGLSRFLVPVRFKVEHESSFLTLEIV